MNFVDVNFSSIGQLRGGILMFRPNEMLHVVDALEAAEIAINGLDAFRLTPSETTPYLEHSLSIDSKELNTWERVRLFLKNYADSEFWFEIVINE